MCHVSLENMGRFQAYSWPFLAKPGVKPSPDPTSRCAQIHLLGSGRTGRIGNREPAPRGPGRWVANLSFAPTCALAPASVPEATAAPGVPIAMDATAFHVGNLLIHLAATLVLFGVVRRTLISEPLRPGFEAAAPWRGRPRC